MIQIKPTTESGLNHNDYSLDLAGRLIFNRQRAQKTQTTLDGSVAITLWPKQKQGAYKEQKFTLSPIQVEALESIVYHASCFEWLVFNDSERFKCAIDIIDAEPKTIGGNSRYQEVTISFLVTEVL